MSDEQGAEEWRKTYGRKAVGSMDLMDGELFGQMKTLALALIDFDDYLRQRGMDASQRLALAAGAAIESALRDGD